MKISEICRDQSARRRLIRAHTNAEGESDLNGIDYVEVDQTQHVITVFFLGKAPEAIRRRNVRIEGGARIRNIRVVKIRLCKIDDPERDDCLKVFVDKPGDFSTYTLKLVNAYNGKPSDEPFDGFDPRYAQIEFSFKANCPTELDCQPQNLCAPQDLPEPEINYLAKDYASFRQLILDRLALVMPEWKERHVPDIGIALVEILAYTGDYLSYYQDAVATESYLDTARQRISVRRHATLVDYQLQEGSNARAWVCVEVNNDLEVDPEDIYFTTRVNSLLQPSSGGQASASNRSLLAVEEIQKVSANMYEVFEPLVQEPQPLKFYVAHNQLSFYTWQDTECCLPRGATSATLIDDGETGAQTPAQTGDEDDNQAYQDDYRQAYQQWKQEVEEEKEQKHRRRDYQQTQGGGYGEQPEPEPERRLHLKAGDVLIFEEVLGPNTGKPEDADPSHRHAVRLTKVEPDTDPLTGHLVVNIEWGPEDALPFSLCISSVGRAPGCELITDVSVARGNVVLCDHGRRVKSDKWTVPMGKQDEAGCVRAGEPRETILRTGYFRPKLNQAPLTHRVPLKKSSVIARRQAKALSELMRLVRARVIELLKQTRRHELLSQEQLDELKQIFGERSLTELGLVTTVKKRGPAPRAKDQAEALEKLLDGAEKLLLKKRKRLAVLRRRALAGYVLTELEHQELSMMFGESLIERLGLKSDLMLGSASAALRQNPRDAMPWIVVDESPPKSSKTNEAASDDTAGANAKLPRKRWTPVRNLLGSQGRDRHFVAEIDDEGFAHLRFGDNDLGRTPDAGSILQAKYRVGQGRAGNVGAESISHISVRPPDLETMETRQSINPGEVRSVRNPLPARGGTEPESTREAKLYAPTAFRKILQRAITSDDYASLAASGNRSGVQQAAASLRWTGSWYEMQVAVDPRGTEEADSQLLEEVSDSLAPVRRMGHDLSVRLAKYVPLEIQLLVCVRPEYLRGHVKAALLDLYSNRRLPGGQLGLFHPDNLTFGDDIYLSQLVAAAQAVPGVESVKVEKLERLDVGRKQEPEEEIGEERKQAIEEGVLRLDALEVARLANDPSFPERGRLMLKMRGGR